MKRVLIVEDYASLADVESLLCTMEGYDVRVARSGDQGLELFADFHPDLVLLDLVLPGATDGAEFLAQIRATGGLATKVLVVSARLDATTTAELTARGDVETLAKPFKLHDLARRIQAMLDSGPDGSAAE